MELALRIGTFQRRVRNHSLTKQVLFSFSLKILTAVASFALSWLIARRFGPTGSGQYGIAVASVVMITYIALFGQDYIVVRKVAGDVRQKMFAEAKGIVRSATAFVILSGSIFTIALVFGQDAISRAFGQHDNRTVLVVILLSIVPLALTRIIASALRGTGAMAWSQVVDGPLSGVWTTTAIGIGLWFGLVDDLSAAAWAYTAGSVVACSVGYFLYWRRTRGWPPPQLAPYWPMLAAGWPIVASNVSNQFTEWYTISQLGLHWPAALAGQYRVAWQFVALLGLAQAALDAVLAPRIAAAWRVDDRSTIARISRQGTIVMVLLVSPLVLVMAVWPTHLLGIFGPDFTSGALALQILAIGQLIRVAAGPAGTILVMTGHQRWIFAYAGIGVVVTTIASAFLIPAYGLVGAATATTLTVAFRSVAVSYIVHRVIGISIFRSGAR